MYTLRIPLRLLDNRKLDPSSVSEQVGGYDFSLAQRGQFWILTVTGFVTEEEARAYADRAWAGLIWLSLKYGILSDFTVEVQEVAYTKDPLEAAKRIGFKDPIDGWIDGGQAAVYPSAKRICAGAAQSITAVMTTRTTSVLELIREGASFPNSGALRQHRKVRIALELYGAFFAEASPSARFLTLMMALEALAHEKKASLPQKLEDLVRATLEGVGDSDALTMAKRARTLYRTRSELVHGKGVESHVLQGAASEAQQIVQRVLKAKVRELTR